MSSPQTPCPSFRRELTHLAVRAGYLVDWLPGNMVQLTHAESGDAAILTALTAAALLRGRLAMQRQTRRQRRGQALH